MPQMAFRITRIGITAYSFTTGVVTHPTPQWRIRNDTDALACALYLERRGQTDEAKLFLEDYLSQHN